MPRGTLDGIVAPLVNGVTSIVDEAEFEVERWTTILEREGVTVWYTAPTAIRRMMKAGETAIRTQSYPRLRHLASVGEPLNPEGVVLASGRSGCRSTTTGGRPRRARS